MLFFLGEAGARYTLRLALLLFSTMLLAGCRTASPPRQELRFVRWEALYPLHPALLQEPSAVRSPPPSLLSEDLHTPLPLSKLPSALPTESPLPETLSSERQQTLSNKSDFFQRQFAESLKIASERRLMRETQAKQKELEAVFTQEVEGKIAELQQVDTNQRAYADRKIHNLGFYEVIYKIQAEKYLGDLRQQARDKWEKTRREIKQYTYERDAPLGDYRGKALFLLRDRRSKIQKEVTLFQDKLSLQIAEETKRILANRNIDLREDLQSVSALKESLPILKTPPLHRTPLASAPLLSSEKSSVREATARRTTSEKEYRQMLETQIQKDTEQTALQLFAKRGWTLTPATNPKAKDATEAVAQALRDQWNISKVGVK